MKYLFSFAVKNILRYKRRTILTFVILSVGIAFYLLMVGIVQGYKKQSIDNFIQFDTGHIKIRNLNYDKDAPYALSNYIQNADEIKRVLGQKKFVKAYTERIQFLGEADNGVDSSPSVIVGIDPVNDPKVFSLTNYITEGNLESGGALLGSTLAKDLGVGVEDSVYITFRNNEGTIDSIELKVSGLLFSSDPVVNGSMVFVPLSDAKKYLNTSNVTEISAITENLNKDKAYIRDIQKDLPGNQIKSWEELAESIKGAAAQDEVTTYIFVVFIAIIALVGIINTMLMSVYEKTREIGTLKALGMSDKEVQGIFVLEGLVIGTVGGIVGLILGALITWYFAAIGYDMTAMLGESNQNMMASLRLAGTIRAIWDIPAFLYAFILSIAISTLASFYPAKKTTRMQPAECLRTIQ